jgi:4-oxalocrotonate tautomerase
MPHVGPVTRNSRRLTQEITDSVTSLFNYGAESVSVGFVEVESQEWAEKVYRPDIQAKWNQLYQKPGYKPLEK